MGNNNEDKLRALDAALGQIEKQYEEMYNWLIG